MSESSHDTPVPQPPKGLPQKRPRRFRSHDDEGFSVGLRVVTPILGGSFFTAGGGVEHRSLDTVRVPTLRGHLRFWWRAMQPASLDWRQLRVRERALWGGMGGGDGDAKASKPQASRVIVRVEELHPEQPEIDAAEPPAGGRGYALFPARKQTKGGQITRDTIPRLKPGITFTLRITCPPEHLDEVRRAVQAWILFGGYGSRTRRGLGSLTVTADAADWLPAAATGDAVKSLLAGSGSTADTPTLAGGSLVVGESTPDAEKAWDVAVGQLQYFRQHPGLARNPGRNPNHPGQSRWPEADKIRHLTGRWGHPRRPEIGPQPAWPRAQFGLPIVGRFKDRDEPGEFQIQWQADGEGEAADRLASPLIVKALPLADGRFVPCALWLARGFPAGKAILLMQNRVVPNSAAAFETMQCKGDRALHAALEGKPSVRQAFLDWLVGECNWKRVSG
jgi:CRISPR-associated protein Cmr1